MIRLIRQIYSGKILEVVREDALWLHIINPDYPSQPFLISREHYQAKWEPYTTAEDFNGKGAIPPPDTEDAFASGGPDYGPIPKKRGRPKGSKNRASS